MNEPVQPVQSERPQVAEEFYLRVNDFIAMANRIERKLDTAHAQLVILHALSRYSAHHYRSTAKVDDAGNRAAFADYMAGAVKELVLRHLDDLAGPAQPVAAADDTPAE